MKITLIEPAMIKKPHGLSEKPIFCVQPLALGVLAGLSTAVLWTATAVCFEASSRRLGSLAVNVLRLLVAAILFTALSLTF